MLIFVHAAHGLAGYKKDSVWIAVDKLFDFKNYMYACIKYTTKI